jgi:hypothetical protein
MSDPDVLERLRNTTDSCAHIALAAVAAFRAHLSRETFLEMATTTWREQEDAIKRLDALIETRIPEINKGGF